MNRRIAYILFIVAVVATMSSCKSKGDRTGFIFIPDMAYSQAYETHAGSENVWNMRDDAKVQPTNRLPVNGTIPRGYIPNDENIKTNDAYLMPYVMKNTYSGLVQDSVYTHYYDMATTDFMNPHPYSADVAIEGKELYNVYCAVCHGESGAGDGSIVAIKDANGEEIAAGPFYSRPPAYESKLPSLTDGQLFFTITYGKGNMGGYASQVTPDERWKIVHYIKDLAGVEPTTVLMPQGAMDSDTTDMSDVEVHAHNGDDNHSHDGNDDHHH